MGMGRNIKAQKKEEWSSYLRKRRRGRAKARTLKSIGAQLEGRELKKKKSG